MERTLMRINLAPKTKHVVSAVDDVSGVVTIDEVVDFDAAKAAFDGAMREMRQQIADSIRAFDVMSPKQQHQQCLQWQASMDAWLGTPPGRLTQLRIVPESVSFDVSKPSFYRLEMRPTTVLGPTQWSVNVDVASPDYAAYNSAPIERIPDLKQPMTMLKEFK
jgi:hypothetical protein